MATNKNKLLKTLYKDGWIEKNQEGGHLHLVHPVKPNKVTISIHSNRDIPKGTYRSILKQAGLL